tara:strand:+ start:22726 stop:23187 length:462 start_codon:yes stop_codon:yes gene_type:complete
VFVKIVFRQSSETVYRTGDLTRSQEAATDRAGILIDRGRKAQMAAKFELYQDKAGEYRFRLKAGNGENILASEGYKAKASCVNGIESVKKNAPEEARYEKKETAAGKFMFNLKSTNGQVVGTSQSYASEKTRDGGIASVMKNAADAAVDDQTA